MGRSSDTATLDYRASALVEASKRALSAAVRHREREYQAHAWWMMITGLAAMVVLPVILAGCVASLEYRLHAHPSLGFWFTFGLATIATVPVMSWLERRTRDSVVDALGHLTASSEAELARPTSGLELIVWGPRRITLARERLSGTVSAAVITEAIATINYLRHFTGGVGTDELPTIQPLPVLRYLATREWVGISEMGDRVWLQKDARRALKLS